MNVLLIMDDALRPDHMGCYGYHKDTTPNIDRLAREGVVFKGVTAVSTHTLPPVFSIITGQNTATHGMMSQDDLAYTKKHNSWGNRRTPIHTLREHGFLIDGELVSRWSELGFDRDTDDIEGFFEEHKGDKWFFMAEPYPTHLPYNPPDGYYRMFLDSDYRPSESTLKNLELVRTRMILHPPDVISAMESGKQDTLGEGDEAHKRSAVSVVFHPEDKPGVDALYDGEVRVFDDLVGRWVTKLEELGILNDTLILITSDHAEELLERGHVGHTSCNLKGTLYDESLMVPLIMRYPSKLPMGRVVKNQISQIDIMPTILDLLGIEIPQEVEGQSMLPLIQGKTDVFREEAYAETMPAGWQALDGDNRRIWCIRTNEWKLILNTDMDLSFRRYELYNLCEDPVERNNLYPLDSEKERDLRDKLERYVESKTRTREK